MQLIAVALDAKGRRVELTLTMPDEFTAAHLDINETRSRLDIMLNREVNRASEILLVADNDLTAAREAAKAPKPKSTGQDQVAFAGSKEKAVLLPGKDLPKKGR